MAIFFDHRVQSGSTSHVDISWHNEQPLLAIAMRGQQGGGVINIFNEEGQALPAANLQRSCYSTSLAWHPTHPSVAVGWESGEILIWNEQDQQLQEATKLHKAQVCLLQWSAKGQRLLSGDKEGTLIMWKSDGKGHLTSNPISQLPSQQTPTQCLFPYGGPKQDDERSAPWSSNLYKGSSSLIADGNACFVGGEEGHIVFMDDKGNMSQAVSVEGPVKKLLYNSHRNVMVVVTKSMALSQYSVSQDGKLTEMMKVKLSGKPNDSDCDMVWAGKGLLATASGESLVRMWDLDKDDNYVLALDKNIGFEMGENITCVAYSSKKGLLAGGTDKGRVAMWRYSPVPGVLGRRQEGETKWKLQVPCNLEGQLGQIKWGSRRDLLATNSFSGVVILNEHIMSASMKDQVAVVQAGPSSISLDVFVNGSHHDIKTDIHIKGICNTKDHVAVWNGKQAVVYEISQTIRATGTFSTDSKMVRIHEQNAYTTEPGKIQVRTFQGTVKQLISMNENEGEPCTMEIMGNYLVVGTSGGFVKMYDVSRREAKPHNTPKNLMDVIPGMGSILMAKTNCNGTKLAIIVSKSDGTTDPKLYVWDPDLDTLGFFDLKTGHGDQEDEPLSKDDDITDAERGREEAAQDVAGRYPINIFWDTHEPKLLVCEAKLSHQEETTTPKKTTSLLSTIVNTQPEMMVVSLFTTLEHGVVLQDSFGHVQGTLLGVEVPYFYFIKKAGDGKTKKGVFPGEKMDDPGPISSSSLVARQVMRNFAGLEDGDKSARDAMMNFSYYLTIGNMDEAFKAIKLIKSESVWENMAKMCVKTRRLDVARVCLGNMGHARGARALREAENEPELDARVAMLAVQLGLLDDAERLYKNCGRYDLLNAFYQASGQWGKAMETAELNDRIHLRTTYYHYAKHLEAKGDINGAIPNYEKSDTHRFEVPRMLFDEPQALEAYIMKTKDRALRKWWAQYMESTGEMETALQFYEAAQDYLSLVRVYCYCGNIDKAAEIANETGDRAACYHLARQHENQDNIKEAIHFFTRAQSYSQAIRLCKEHDMEDQLMNLALMSTKEDMIEAARYYENNRNTHDKAVMLFHKGGHFSKALELAFESQQFGALQLISEDLDERTDPVLLNRCAQFFMEHGQYDKAVDLLVVAGKYFEALELCQDHNVNITERLAEKMTLSKDDSQGDMRLKLLEKVADLCFLQGSYHLATKKYTQAGNKVKAMRALLKSGDTEKIIFFAGVSRQKEIYVMAANYLQSLDWRKDPEIMKNIIGFYTKGRALDSLAGFYDACAQVEIDEYQNYDKALGALTEAYKCLSKAKVKNQTQIEEKLGALKHRISLVKKFVQARRAYDEEPEESMRQCQVLLEETELDSAIRIGDVYGMMVEHYARQENYKKAYAFMEEMRSRIATVNMAYYINIRTIEAVHRALDIPLGRGTGAEKKGVVMGDDLGQDEDDGEEVEEDVQEDYNEDEAYC
ncbi:intraflagellar transport protein 140 homolog isoform X2 [Lytechinus variegatus]|uniref:intraflagellar transport protein 140 homolog isoform X2 n=1 Tax=Lytechinus variegatus TaxID=7654 RepID=UPI001BB1DF33|nr:intraflagellar transport protein 140 homolog isoform X2 [Lytechinus variegatus]